VAGLADLILSDGATNIQHSYNSSRGGVVFTPSYIFDIGNVLEVHVSIHHGDRCSGSPERLQPASFSFLRPFHQISNVLLLKDKRHKPDAAYSGILPQSPHCAFGLLRSSESSDELNRNLAKTPKTRFNISASCDFDRPPCKSMNPGIPLNLFLALN
jgi:hypothetical protein